MQRLSVNGAARQLGLSESAIRSRIFRGTLNHEKDSDGNVWVLLSDDAADQSNEHYPTALIDVLEDKIQSLERQLAKAEERDRENRRLLAAALERIPAAIEPPADELPDAPDSPVTASEEESKGQVTPEPETAESEPWWRRIFR